MPGHFTLDVDVEALRAAQRRIAELGRQLEEEGGKLAAVPDAATDWTGGHAVTLKRAVGLLAADMRSGAPLLAEAATAVAELRRAAVDALDALPGLNRRWEETVTAFDAAVTGAQSRYDSARESAPPQVWRAEQPELARVLSAARVSAAADRDAAQARLEAEYDALVDSLERAARVCGRAMASATLSPVSRETAAAYAASGRNPDLGLGELAPADYLRGRRPLRRDATDVLDDLVARGVLPPEVADMSADELDAYLLEHPEVARRLVDNRPYGDPGSAEQILHGLTLPQISAPGTDTLTQRLAETRRFFESLSTEEQRILAMVYPSVVGNLPGTPFSVRAQANRIRVVVALDDETARLADLREQDRRNESDWDFLGRNNDDLDGAIADAARRVSLYESVLADGRTIVFFDPAGDGAMAELHGTIHAGTSNVGVLVPGTGSDLAGFDGVAGRSRGFLAHHQDLGLDDLAMVTWLGGDLPDSVVQDAPFNHYASDLAPSLAGFSRELRQEVERAGGDDVALAFAGHSYGGSVVGTSEKHGLDADRVLHIESAGMGPGVDAPDDLHPRNRDVRRYSMTAEADFIGLVQGADAGPDNIGHGADPDTFPGTLRLDTGNFADGSLIDGTFASHSDVFTRHSDAWENMYEVFVGGEVRRYRPAEYYTSPHGHVVQVPYTEPAEEVDIP